MGEKTERVVLAVLAAVGLAHEMYTRHQLLQDVIGDQLSRAGAAHRQMLLWQKLARFAGEKSLRAEARYWKEASNG